MKVVLALVVFGGLTLVVVYFVGGYASFDPSEKGRQVKAALLPGMPFGNACDITGDPKRFRIINRKVSRVGGSELVEMVPSQEAKCSRARINERLTENSLPHGFLCTFVYSADVALTVKYDGQGKIVDVTDAVTVSSLLYPKD